MSEFPVAVIGAGVVGLCCALALRRRGVDVLLIDRGGPGEGCSFGNGGMIQTGSSLPIGVPGLAGKIPRMIFDPEGPLSLRWRHLPSLLPWGVRFLANCSASAARRNENLLADLLKEALSSWRNLTNNTPAAAVFRQRGELYVVRSQSALEALRSKIEACERHGVVVETLDATSVRRYEPQLAPTYQFGLYLPESAFVTDPLLLSQRIFENFCAVGGRFERGEVLRILRCGSKAKVVLQSQRELFASKVIVAAGAQSARLVAASGAKRLPIEPLRGYHVLMPHLKTPLAGPVIEGEMNIAITPMLSGNRIAGTIEFAGQDAPPNWQRANMLVPMAKNMVPGLSGEVLSRWVGDRPGTPDSLPIVGPLEPDGPIWLSCGHGTLGLTLAARTSLLLADALLGDLASTATMKPFLPTRFSGRVVEQRKDEA